MERKPYRYSFEPPERLESNPLYAQLRSAEPIVRVRVPYGREAWLVTRYDAVRAVLSDSRFSRALAVGPDTPRVGPLWARAGSLVTLDPPDHTRLRKLVAPAFSPRRVESLRHRTEEIIAGLLDELTDCGPPADLVQMLTLRVPVMMICEMLGVPYDDRGKFGGLPRMIMSATAGAQANQAGTDLLEYLRGLIIERRARPTVDMISALVQACDNDGQITEDELVALAENLLVGSYETTANEMANFLFILLSRPDQLAWLRQDLSRVPAAVEELLRFVPLAAGAPGAGGHARIATADVELDGVTIRAGDAVLPSIVSANRDERVFAQPDQLDLTRRSNPHVAFGHGIHHCVGAQLARMELQATLAGLLSRFPALRLAVPPDEVPWKIGFIQRGPAELLAEW